MKQSLGTQSTLGTPGARRRPDRAASAVDNLLRDLIYALRALRRDLGFAIGVVLIIAIGIGANTAVFSIVADILFSALPYRNAERLMVIEEVRPPRAASAAVSPRHFREWRRECRCFEEIALSDNLGQKLNLTSTGEDSERVSSARVTPNLFAMLGVEAQLGRTFVAEDAESREDQVVLISDALWHRRFGADREIIGKRIGLDGASAVIVGVLPIGFRHYHPGADEVSSGNGPADVFRPWAVEVENWWGWDNNYSYAALGRLQEGVSAEAAAAELNAVQAEIVRQYFDAGARNVDLRAQLVPLREWLTQDSRAELFLLLIAVAVAFLVACLNVASLMLVRAVARRHDAGVRSALGASRLHLFRGVLVESSVLSVLGAALGTVLAIFILGVFEAVAPASLPRVNEVQASWTAVLVAMGLCAAATLLFGLLPAIKTTRVYPQDALRSRSRGFTDAKGRYQKTLVLLEVGLSTCLLVVAGLLLSSFLKLEDVERGFDATNVLTAEISLPARRYGNSYSGDALRRFNESLVERLESNGEVVAAGVTSMLPLAGYGWGGAAAIPGDDRPLDEMPAVQYRFVSPNYFQAMGLPLLAGRSPVREDHPRNVAVVSERLAQLLSPGENPVGRYFHRGDPEELFEIVGVVPDVHSEDLASDPGPIAYAAHWVPGGGQVWTITVRTVGDPEPAIAALRDAVRSLDPDVPIANIRTMEQIDRAALAERRFQLALIATFAIASLLVAALGIYSVLAYGVAGRSHEIAVRMALGAQQRRVLGMVLRQGLGLVVVGVVAGMVGALAMGRLVSGLLFEVTPGDPATLVAVSAVILAAALLACWLPARRAARTSLLEALRDE